METITEIEVLPLEKVIEQTLIRENVTDKVIAELKNRYGALKLKSLDDHEGYLDISEARKTVRKVGILAEKICKQGRSDAVRTQKLWLQKEADVLEKIGEVQDPLDAEIKKFEDEKERRELEESKRQEQQFQQRQQSIVRLGANWIDGSFVLSEISYEVSIIKEVDDEMWDAVIFPKYQKVFDRVEAERVAEETKRREAEEKLKAEQEAFRKQQEEFRQQQEAFAKQKAEMDRMQSEADRLKREAEEQAAAKHRQQRQEKLDNRMKQLYGLGMTFSFQYDAFVFEDVNVDNHTEICLFNDAEWDNLIAIITPVIAERKAAAELKKEEIRLAELEKAKEQARKDETERIAAIQRQKEADARLAEENRQKALAEAGDKANWEDVVGKLKAIQFPAFKSGQYRRIAQIAKEKIEEAITLKP